MSEKLCLQWNDFKENVTSAFGNLREGNYFADVTLACEDGKQFEAHKVILASSSPFFQNILTRNKHAHPLIYMRNMKSEDLVAILDFLYCGEANVFQENLDSFLAIAEELQLKGLMGKSQDDKVEIEEIPDSGKIQKHEFRNTKFSEPFQNVKEMTGTEHDTGVRTLALENNFAGDLQELENQTNSMIVKISNKINGKQLYKCTLCGKESDVKTNIKNHIEAKHLEGISIPCNLCEKTFRSRNSLANHNHVYHKHTLSH